MRLIDADELLKNTKGGEWDGLWFSREYVTVEDIKNAPTIDERKSGEWIKHPRYTPEEMDGIEDDQPNLDCPFCGHQIGWFDMGLYCPKCGAQLKGSAGDDDE